ncbi:aspartic peptidase domain-containing protein, partial [Usnea florida]
DGDDGSWSSFALRVGSSEQVVRVLPSTAGQETWVVSPQGCPPGRNGTSPSSPCSQSRGGLFDSTQSSSWQTMGNYTLDLELNLGYNDTAVYGFDTVALGFANSIGGPTINSQVISALETDDYYLGVFGLGNQGTNISNFTDPQPTFLTAMRNKSLIPSLSWAYTAGAPYHLKGVFGSLTFGGYDRSRFVPNNVSLSQATDPSRNLVVGLQSILSTATDHSTTLVTQQQSLLPNPILTFIDSTLPYIYLPNVTCQNFEKTLGLEWNSTEELYLVNETLHQSLLSKNLTFTFTITDAISGGPTVQIELPYASFDLEVKPPYIQDTTRYFPLQPAVDESQYTLGRTFLQEAYLIVDYERSNFSVSQCRFDEDGIPTDLVAIPSITEKSNHLRRNVGMSIGAALLLLLATLAAVFAIRRWRQK